MINKKCGYIDSHGHFHESIVYYNIAEVGYEIRKLESLCDSLKQKASEQVRRNLYILFRGDTDHLSDEYSVSELYKERWLNIVLTESMMEVISELYAKLQEIRSEIERLSKIIDKPSILKRSYWNTLRKKDLKFKDFDNIFIDFKKVNE